MAAMAEHMIRVEAANTFMKLLDEVVNAPKVPPEVIGTEELDTFFDGLVPSLQQEAMQLQKDVTRKNLYEIWLEHVKRRRATRALPF